MIKIGSKNFRLYCLYWMVHLQVDPEVTFVGQKKKKKLQRVGSVHGLCFPLRLKVAK